MMCLTVHPSRSSQSGQISSLMKVMAFLSSELDRTHLFSEFKTPRIFSVSAHIWLFLRPSSNKEPVKRNFMHLCMVRIHIGGQGFRVGGFLDCGLPSILK